MTDTSSEAHRAACEAREVATWDTERLNSFLEKVAKARGQAAADKLREGARQAWIKERSTTKSRQG